MKKVSPIAAVNVVDIEKESQEQSLGLENRNDGKEGIEIEREQKLYNATMRHHSYRDILFNEDSNRYSSYIPFLGLNGVLLGLFMNSITALVPVHNVIYEPEYFYEVILTNMFFTPLVGAQFLYQCSYWMNIDYIRTFKKYITIAFSLVAYRVCIQGVLYIVWVYELQNPYPMRFHTTIGGLMMFPFGFFLLWMQFPKEWRRTGELKKRFLYFMLAYMINFLIHTEYTIYTSMFVKISPKLQWVLALTLPFAREFNLWLQLKTVYRAADAKDSSVEISCSYMINTRHCVFLSVMLGTAATDLTSWVILGSDFLFNLFLTLRIMWMKRKKDINVKMEGKMINNLLCLTVNEIVEAVVPLSFFVCFLVSYYGPNAALIGGVKSDFFHYTPVTNIERFIENLFLFIAVDFMSVVTAGIFLWIFSKVNLLRMYMNVMKEFWPIMTINTAYSICVVSVLSLEIFEIKCYTSF